MERHSLLEYFDNFLQLGRESAYIQRRGYRTVRWTYRQVAETAFQFAGALEKRGLERGDRVLIWGPNSAEWVATFFGCALRGVLVATMGVAAAPVVAFRVPRALQAT